MKVGKFLLLMGFYPATHDGAKLDHVIDNHLLGVLCSDSNSKSKKKRWLGLVAQKPRYVFLGIIYFNNKPRYIGEKSWIFEVHREKNIELVKLLIEDMSLFFEVKIDLRLVNKKSRFESFMSKY